MVDFLTKKQRSALMAKVHGRDTKPEWVIRSALHRLGFRYTLKNNRLPGKPDIVLKKYKTVIFIHGCFWHAHAGCTKATIPKSNTDFWVNKLNSNVERDKKNKKILEDSGWRVIILWECEIFKDTIKTISEVVDLLLTEGCQTNVNLSSLDHKILIKNAEKKVKKKFDKNVE